MITASEAKKIVENYKSKALERKKEELKEVEEKIIASANMGRSYQSFETLSTYVQETLKEKGFYIEFYDVIDDPYYDVFWD